MVGISHFFNRKQPPNLPSETWQRLHTQQDKDRYLDPRIAYLLEREYDEILRWAVGNRWSITDPIYWPRRIRARTGVEIREGSPIDEGLSRLREAWDKWGRQDAQGLGRFRPYGYKPGWG